MKRSVPSKLPKDSPNSSPNLIKKPMDWTDFVNCTT